MSNLTPLPNDDSGSRKSRSSRRRPNRGGQRDSRHKAQGEIPTAEECLVRLNRLAGLVAVGVLTPSQANTMRAAYQAILQHHQHRQTPTQQSLAGPELLAKLRSDPDLVNMLADFLTDDQLNDLLQNPPEANDESL